MKEFDYLIIGGGCAGLSLAYELEINGKLKDKTLAIVEPRKEYNRDKTWSQRCSLGWRSLFSHADGSRKMRQKRSPGSNYKEDSGCVYGK